jgi:hypothetical protein
MKDGEFGPCRLCVVCSWDIWIPVLRNNDPAFPWTMWFFQGKHVQELHKPIRGMRMEL